ncbi:hypothetical protein HDU76_005954 [Blyttiomyces sp. JEL0837]|nr:hypothetical protein HDU76_005954 [Blyttiomyces sp. JEL0837]
MHHFDKLQQIIQLSILLQLLSITNLTTAQWVGEGCYNWTSPVVSLRASNHAACSSTCLAAAGGATTWYYGLSNRATASSTVNCGCLTSDVNIHVHDAAVYCETCKFPEGGTCGSTKNDQDWYFLLGGSAGGGGVPPTTSGNTGPTDTGNGGTSTTASGGNSGNGNGNGGSTSATDQATNSPINGGSVTGTGTGTGTSGPGSPTLIPGGSGGNSNGQQGSGDPGNGSQQNGGNDGNPAGNGNGGGTSPVIVGVGAVVGILVIGGIVGLFVWSKRRKVVADDERNKKAGIVVGTDIPLEVLNAKQQQTTVGLTPVPSFRRRDTEGFQVMADAEAQENDIRDGTGRAINVPEKSDALFTQASGFHIPVLLSSGVGLSYLEKVKRDDPAMWTNEQVVAWLRANAFSQKVCDRFKDAQINGYQILKATPEYLRNNLGFERRDTRLDLMSAIDYLRNVSNGGSANGGWQREPHPVLDTEEEDRSADGDDVGLVDGELPAYSQ